MASEVRRDRPLRTCLACKRRKVRCDKIHPSCSQCQKGKLACAYDDEQPQRLEFQFIAETPGSTTGLASGQSQSSLGRLAREEDFPTPLRGHISQQPGRRLRYLESSYWAYDPNDEETMDTLLADQTRFETFDPLEGSEREVPGGAARTGTQTSATVSEKGSSISGTSGAKYLRGPPTTIPYRLTGDLAAPPPAFKPTEITTSRYQRRPSTIFLNALPPKALCDRLLDLYVKGYHPIAPVIHIPTFKAEYESLWKIRPDDPAQRQGTSHFICLLLAILFAGAVVCPKLELLRGFLPAHTHSREDLEKSLHERASKALRQASFPRTPSLETLTAYIIIQVTWMRFEEPLSTCSFIGTAYRVSQIIGLHRDPSSFVSIPPIIAEVRRRVWWFLLHIDVTVGLAAGLPPMIDILTSDVRQVSELKEELIGTPKALEYEAHLRQSGGHADYFGPESMFSTASILHRGKYDMTAVTKELLSLMYGSKAITPQDLIRMRDKIRHVAAELKLRINKIPLTPIRTSFDVPFHSMASQQSGDSYLNSWARLYMSLLTDRTWMIACHPALKAPISKVWGDIQPKALEHCRDYLRKTAQLSCFEEFQYFHWSWPGHHQPLISLMVVLTELRKRPQSAAATSLREVVDIIFALCGPGGGLVAIVGDIVRQRPLTEGGSESWDLLWRCRSRAWRAAGLDPHVLWTREQALASLYSTYDQAEQDILPDPPVPNHELDEGFDLGAPIPAGTSQTLDTGLVDLNTPMPNVDMSFWDQMVDEHGQMDFDLGNYENFDLGLDNN